MTRPWLWHGGGLQAARAHFGDGEEPWLDLSTGINPHAWPAADRIAIDWRHLPETCDLQALEMAAAHHFGVDPCNVCALPGTEIGLRLAETILPGPARFVAPSYRTHGEMFGGAAPVEFAAARGTLILANPNNPDGRVIDRQALLGYPDWLIVDEAFADCNPGPSLAPDIAEDRPLVIFRSFGKFFGLAGLRLGFVIAPVSVIADFRARLGAWPLSAAAVAIGTAAYRDADWIAAMRRHLPRERNALVAVLDRHGFQTLGACPLFCLVDTPDANGLFELLARRSILTRPFDYAPHWLRLGLPGSDAALERLDRALGRG